MHNISEPSEFMHSAIKREIEWFNASSNLAAQLSKKHGERDYYKAKLEQQLAEEVILREQAAYAAKLANTEEENPSTLVKKGLTATF